MKCVRFSVATSVLCLALTTVPLLLAEGEGRLREPDLGTRLVKMILNVDYAVQESEPPNLVVTVTGQVPTAGHGNVRLVRANYAKPPEDGIQDYFLLATPPSGAAAQVISEVQATDTWNRYTRVAPWIKGIRVHGADDSVVVRRFPN